MRQVLIHLTIFLYSKIALFKSAWHCGAPSLLDTVNALNGTVHLVWVSLERRELRPRPSWPRICCLTPGALSQSFMATMSVMETAWLLGLTKQVRSTMRVLSPKLPVGCQTTESRELSVATVSAYTAIVTDALFGAVVLDVCMLELGALMRNWGIPRTELSFPNQNLMIHLLAYHQ